MTARIISPSIPKLDEQHKNKLFVQVEEAGLIVIHCSHTSELGGRIRIWPSTFLSDRDSPCKSKMLHVFDITMAPQWLYVPPRQTIRFTLVFEPLPETSTVFNFLEEIPMPGGFSVTGITRNKSDVYRLEIG